MESIIADLEKKRESGAELKFIPIKLLGLDPILELLDRGFDISIAHDYNYTGIEAHLNDPRFKKLIPLLPTTLVVGVTPDTNPEVVELLKKRVNAELVDEIDSHTPEITYEWNLSPMYQAMNKAIRLK